MAKITLSEHLSSMSGKVCRKSRNSVIYKTRKFDGATFAAHQDSYKSYDEFTPAQKSHCQRFVALQKLVKAELADASKRTAYTASWKAQKHYKTVRSLVAATIWATRQDEILAAVQGNGNL